MAFSVPPLSYALDALEPHIDARRWRSTTTSTTRLRRQGQCRARGHALADMAVEDILRDLSQVPEDKRAAVKNNAGGHHNHTLFWESMSPTGGGEPSGELADAINQVRLVADFRARSRKPA